VRPENMNRVLRHSRRFTRSRNAQIAVLLVDRGTPGYESLNPAAGDIFHFAVTGQVEFVDTRRA